MYFGMEVYIVKQEMWRLDFHVLLESNFFCLLSFFAPYDRDQWITFL